MSATSEQRFERWGKLVREIREALSAFEAAYEDFRPKPEDGLGPGRRFQHAYLFRPSIDGGPPQCADDDAARAARAAVLERLDPKREHWLALWNRAADLIAACESEHVRSAPDDATWAAQTAQRMRERIADLVHDVQTKHPDMPDILFEREEKTGRFCARWGGVDGLETIYFGFWEDERNPDVRNPAARQRGQEFREWIDYLVANGYHQYSGSTPPWSERHELGDRS